MKPTKRKRVTDTERLEFMLRYEVEVRKRDQEYVCHWWLENEIGCKEIRSSNGRTPRAAIDNAILAEKARAK